MEFFALAKEEVRERDLEADAEADDVQLAWQFITAIWAGTSPRSLLENLF